MFNLSIEYYKFFTWMWILLGVIVFFVLFFITAPYGRHTKSTWGPMINNKIGWFIMEFFLLIVLYFFIIKGKNFQSTANLFILFLLTAHYVNRSIVFPLRIRTKGKKMPISIMFMALVFNLVNGFLFGYYLGEIKIYNKEWLFSPQFIFGLLIFSCGVYINWKSDAILIHLRKKDDDTYKIPFGGLFKYISCPNLLGEVIEWFGFAVLTWSLPGLAFFVWTFANLVPRAISHHKWYKSKFENYPEQRKAIFPFIC